MVGQKGFTLVELMIVVAIIAILAIIAYPSYQNYVIKTKRTDMMTELTAIAGRIEAAKLTQGSYSKIQVSDYAGNFPKSGQALYTTKMELTKDAQNRVIGWKLTATPIAATTVAKDGNLTYDSKGVKCRAAKCGVGDEWQQSK